MDTFTKKIWHVQKPDPTQVDMLTRSCGCHPIVAGILINRGITDPEKAIPFLNPSPAHIRSPFLMKNMAKAVERILSVAIGNYCYMLRIH